jgi:hypothetical protein
LPFLFLFLDFPTRKGGRSPEGARCMPSARVRGYVRGARG